MDLKVTHNASQRIAALIAQSALDKKALRISVDGGGCNGFKYQYDLVDNINQDDFIVEEDGIKVIIDPISQEFLNGCVVEFVEELGASYFQINNPKASAKCGCGNSFSI